MMVVVADTRKPLCIKGISLQHPYNQGILVPHLGLKSTWLYLSCNAEALQDKAFGPITTTTMNLKIEEL